VSTVQHVIMHSQNTSCLVSVSYESHNLHHTQAHAIIPLWPCSSAAHADCWCS